MNATTQHASTIRALTFDVFGTVVDWRGSIIREINGLARQKGVKVDAGGMADAWRAGYAPAMDRVRKGALGWTRIDELHREILEGILDRFGLGMLAEAERVDLNRVWHRLRPWPDVVNGLKHLKRRFVLATLSNGNVSLLADLARFGKLPFDVILSAELFHHYKPDPETYLGSARLLDVAPSELMMVAAHKSDLFAAQAQGLATALVLRPLEYGRGRHPDPGPDPGFDFNAPDFLDLARQLGA